jgi:hypothetical protein
MRWLAIVAFCACSSVALAQITVGGGTANAPTTRPHGTAAARPMTPMERIAELERRVAELERLVAQLTGATQPSDTSPATQPVAAEPTRNSIFDTPNAPTTPKEAPKAATPPKPATPAAPATPATPADEDFTSRIRVGDTKEAFDKEFADWKSEWVAKYSDSSHKTYRYTNPKTGKKMLASFKRSNNTLDSWNVEQ